MNRRDFVVETKGIAFTQSAFGRVDRLLQQSGRAVSVFRARRTTTAAAHGFATCVKVVGIGSTGDAVLRLLSADGVGVVAETISIGADPATFAHDENLRPWEHEGDGHLASPDSLAAAASTMLDGTHLAIIVVGDADAADLRLATGLVGMARQAGALTFAMIAPQHAKYAPGADQRRNLAMKELTAAGAWLVRGPMLEAGELARARSLARQLAAAVLHPIVSNIRDLVEILAGKLIGIDFDDLRCCFPGSGVVSHATGQGVCNDMAGLAARRALAGRGIVRALSSASGIVVTIEGHQAAIKMKHVEEVLDVIYPALPAGIPRICGTVFNDRMPCHMLGVGIYVAQLV